MIVCYYIETHGTEGRERLEKLLQQSGYSYYDATEWDPYTGTTRTSCRWASLDEIEADIEAK